MVVVAQQAHAAVAGIVADVRAGVVDQRLLQRRSRRRPFRAPGDLRAAIAGECQTNRKAEREESGNFMGRVSRRRTIEALGGLAAGVNVSMHSGLMHAVRCARFAMHRL